MKQQTYSFKVSDKTKDELIDYFEFKKRDKTPAYAIFQADEADTVVTLYESGKVVFQGITADIDANMWMEREYHNSGIKVEEKEKKKEKTKQTDIFDNRDYYNINSIGSDEVGTGDFFGPIVVTASYVNKSNINFLETLGVKDSKKLTDEKIINIAPLLIKNIPHVTYTLNNEDYNMLRCKDVNMNKTKAILHNRALYSLMKKDNYNIDMIVVDQFEPEKAYYNHISDINSKIVNITFTTKAEDKCLSVAVSSIISRYIFLKEMDKISKELNMLIPLGASDEVTKTAIKIKDKYGIDTLKKYVKLNFKNMDKINE